MKLNMKYLNCDMFVLQTSFRLVLNINSINVLFLYFNIVLFQLTELQLGLQKIKSVLGNSVDSLRVISCLMKIQIWKMHFKMIMHVGQMFLYHMS